MNSGGIVYVYLKRKIVRVYENNDEFERCFVWFYKEYMVYVFEDVFVNLFYLRFLKELKGNIWYYKVVVGWEMLGNVVV